VKGIIPIQATASIGVAGVAGVAEAADPFVGATWMFAILRAAKRGGCALGRRTVA
jgi:hypothetical protein